MSRDVGKSEVFRCGQYTWENCIIHSFKKTLTECFLNLQSACVRQTARERGNEKETDLPKSLQKTRGETGDHNKRCIWIVQQQC